MTDIYAAKINEAVGIMDKAIVMNDSVREREEDLLKRQIILCQDAIMQDPKKFIGMVELFECMLQEDIDKKKTPYDTDTIITRTRAHFGMKPMDKTTWEIEYKIALEKFKVLYKIFKETHMPLSVEARI